MTIRNNFLISVVRKGVVVALHWSHMLKELATIKALHPDCVVTATDMRDFKEAVAEPLPPRHEKQKLARNGKPFPNRVRCIETGEVYDSVYACSIAMGISSRSIYSGMRNGFSASGYHFEYLPPEQKKKKKRGE